MSIDTVNDLPPRVQYVATASQVAFDYPFPIFADADLVVDVDGTTQALSTDYTVAGEGDDAGGTLTFLSAMAGGEVVTIYRDMALERTTDFSQNGEFSSDTFNDELDRMVLIQQQLAAAVKRALRVPQADATADADMELPSVVNRASKYLYFNASGDPEMATAVAATQVFSQSTIGTALYTAQTPAELSAGVTPADAYYPQGDSRRYATLADWGLVGGQMRLVGSHTMSSAITIAAGSSVDAKGATITMSGAATRINLNAETLWEGGDITGPGQTFSSGNYAFYAIGTAGSAAVAPTYKQNIRIKDVHISGFGDSAIVFWYIEYAWVEGCFLEDIAYCGVACVSCLSVMVDGNQIENLSGETSSGELNAYGVTFSTSDNSSSDLVRYPSSAYCVARNNFIIGVPTWHALDAHAGVSCVFENNVMLNCRRGAVLTYRSYGASENCLIQNNLYINEYAVGAVNSNGTRKRAEAFWDLAGSASYKGSNNVIRNNTVYGAGDPEANSAAIPVKFTTGGTITGNTFINCYNCGIVLWEYVEDYEISHNNFRDMISIGIAAGSPTDNPQGIKLSSDYGNNFSRVTISHNHFAKKNTTLALQDFSIALLLDADASNSIFLAGNTFENIPTKFSSGGVAGFEGTTGDLEASFTGTLTGMTGSVTGTVKYSREGRVVSLTLPAMSGTSNTTAMTMTGMPTFLAPTTAKTIVTRGVDNGTTDIAIASVASSGVVTFTNGVTGAVWTGSGTKGVPVSTLTYTLD